MSDILNEELDSMFVSSKREFLGKPLSPYTEGSRLLLMQVRDDEDSHVYFVWSFVYLHIILAENREKAIGLAWNKSKFRQAVFDFLADKSREDCDTATAIATAMIEEANTARVGVAPGGGGDSGKV